MNMCIVGLVLAVLIFLIFFRRREMFEETMTPSADPFMSTQISSDDSLPSEVLPIASITRPPMKMMATTPLRRTAMKPASAGVYKSYMCKQGPGGLECKAPRSKMPVPGKVIS